MSRDGSETREKILIATLELLKSGEPGLVRMSDIARSVKISRQALYLHFPSRAELLIEATHYLDISLGREERLEKSRKAETGRERLEAYVDAWCNLIPEIYGVVRALLVMKDNDEEVAAAWDERMSDMREGCEAAVLALYRDGDLKPGLTKPQATDMLWTLLSVRNWEQFRHDCNWSQKKYVATMKTMASDILAR